MTGRHTALGGKARLAHCVLARAANDSNNKSHGNFFFMPTPPVWYWVRFLNPKTT
jgi:hypothetical protein